jgi:hypothetical protein
MATVLEIIQTHGNRKAARALVNLKINKMSGLSLSELPDTAELCNIVDEVEEMIASDGYDEDNEIKISNYLNEQITNEFIEELVYS